MKLKDKSLLFFALLCLTLSATIAEFFLRWSSADSYFYPYVGLLVVLWLTVVGFFLHLQNAKGKSLDNAKELDDVRKVSRVIRQEIDFYEKKKKELTERAQQRRQLSEAVRELGSQLDPTVIQEKLFSTAQMLFKNRFVQITVGQNPDPVDQFVFERKQAVQIPTSSFKGHPLMAVPIFSQGSVAGVLRIGGEPNGVAFTKDDLRTLEILASLASGALDNTFLFAKVQENALRDNLTGLWTHKVFQDQLESEILQASRYGQKLCVILSDVDHFKNVNDTYGHQAGDQVLQGFAQVLNRNVRDVDFVARYGGEEFVMLLVDTPAAQGKAVAEKIRQDLERQRFSSGGKVISMTSSFGVSVFPDDATSAQQLVRKADERLYQAKHAGRNQVIGRAA